MCSSKTAEFRKCMDPVFCTQSDDLYQFYLVSVGVVDQFTFLCANDTFSGLFTSTLNFLHLYRIATCHLLILLPREAMLARCMLWASVCLCLLDAGGVG